MIGANLNYGAILEQVKDATKTGLSMMECALELANRHLNALWHNAGDLMACRPEIFCSLELSYAVVLLPLRVP